jgi:hypothetical protein
MELPKSTVDKINKDLNSENIKTEEDALNYLKGLKNEQTNAAIFTEEQAKAALNQSLFKWGKNSKFKLVSTEKAIDSDKTYDNLRAFWNKDAEALQRQSETGLGKAAIWFGNKFGGGAYSGKQRAMMQNLASDDAAWKAVSEQMDYDSWYNPMVDWKGLRSQAGMRMIPERTPLTTTQTGSTGASATGTAAGTNATPKKTYVSRGMAPESDEMDNAGFSQNWGRVGKTAADEALKIV